jgi:ribosome-binding protein aMBF1 (putative translation factor)
MRREKRCVLCGEQDDRTLDGKCHCAACYSAKRAKEKAVKQTKKQETGETMMYNDVWQIVRDRFPERLREARKRANISQAKLADLVGVEKETIAGYERKGRIPAVDIAAEIAKALSVPLSWLIGMDDCDEVQE